jgi:endonuclease YncB( thermonuclease family)
MNKLQTLAIWAIKNGYSTQYNRRGSVEIRPATDLAKAEAGKLGLWYETRRGLESMRVREKSPEDYARELREHLAKRPNFSITLD